MDQSLSTTPTSCPLEGNPNQTPSIAKLAQALSRAQGAMKGAAKDATNPHFKSKYADLASVWDACRVALAANDLAVIQTTAGDGRYVTVVTTLCHASGEWIRGELTMIPSQTTPQGIGSALTYARRYALAAMVGVAPEEDDGDAASRAPAQSASTPKPASKPKAKVEAKTEKSTLERCVTGLMDLGVSQSDAKLAADWYNAEGSLDTLFKDLVFIHKAKKEGRDETVSKGLQHIRDTVAGDGKTAATEP